MDTHLGCARVTPEFAVPRKRLAVGANEVDLVMMVMAVMMMVKAVVMMMAMVMEIVKMVLLVIVWVVLPEVVAIVKQKRTDMAVISEMQTTSLSLYSATQREYKCSGVCSRTLPSPPFAFQSLMVTSYMDDGLRTASRRPGPSKYECNVCFRPTDDFATSVAVAIRASICVLCAHMCVLKCLRVR